ncbi:MAG: hypothetical protein ABI999_12625 [Acidobacteriota bacterium]
MTGRDMDMTQGGANMTAFMREIPFPAISVHISHLAISTGISGKR